MVDAVARNNIVSLKGERDLFLGLKHLKIAHNPALKRRLSTRQRVAVWVTLLLYTIQLTCHAAELVECSVCALQLRARICSCTAGY